MKMVGKIKTNDTIRLIDIYQVYSLDGTDTTSDIFVNLDAAMSRYKTLSGEVYMARAIAIENGEICWEDVEIDRDRV